MHRSIFQIKGWCLRALMRNAGFNQFRQTSYDRCRRVRECEAAVATIYWLSMRPSKNQGTRVVNLLNLRVICTHGALGNGQ